MFETKCAARLLQLYAGWLTYSTLSAKSNLRFGPGYSPDERATYLKLPGTSIFLVWWQENMFSHGAEHVSRAETSFHFRAIDAMLLYPQTFRTVGKWNLAPVVSFLLLSILLLIGLIQVLPQVDLPDTAFHEDTAPAVMKFRVTSAPILSSAIVTSRPQLSSAVASDIREMSVRPSHTSGKLIPVLHCSLLC